VLTLFVAPSSPTQAQEVPRCFPETGYCITGRIREFWEQNGGLPVFGLPITPLQIENVEGQGVQVQWFERNRLELHPNNDRPYDVLLGRLGAARLGGPEASEATADANCLFFAQTRQNVCGDILALWRSKGLNLDGRAAVTEGESLALFGLPLTPLRSETLPNGLVRQVQWFERARFEIHPDNQPPYRVLLGLLGKEASPTPQVPPRKIGDVPLRMRIPAIALDHRVVTVGLDQNNAPVVPNHDIGWYQYSARPGVSENVVFWGHVLRFRETPNIPAPFARLKELKPGAEIFVIDAQGASFRYRVSEQLWVKPNQVEYILPRGRGEMVTMVSCIGEQVIVDGEVVDLSHRLITIAVPAN
jgi:sortase (surface protein transpeptidase)